MAKVSVVLLNWNGKNFLKTSLASLQKVIHPDFEIIVVDNNSSDGSQEFVRKTYPDVVLIENKENYGFAKGNNIGFKATTGEYVLILNNDAQVTPNFLKPLFSDFNTDPTIACIQPQIRLVENKQILDGVGAFLTSTGFLYHFGYLKNVNNKKYTERKTIFSAKGACMLLKRNVIEKIGLFDEDFFIFFEETDLCFRIWLSGYKVVYEPKSIIYHLGGGDTDSSNSYQRGKRLYLSIRNMICCYLKNFGTLNLITIFPFLILMHFSLCVIFLFQGKWHFTLTIFKAYLWNVRNFYKTLNKRENIQHSLRKISDLRLNKDIILNPRWEYYYYLLTSVKRYKD